MGIKRAVKRHFVKNMPKPKKDTTDIKQKQ